MPALGGGIRPSPLSTGCLDPPDPQLTPTLCYDLPSVMTKYLEQAPQGLSRGQRGSLPLRVANVGVWPVGEH